MLGSGKRPSPLCAASGDQQPRLRFLPGGTGCPRPIFRQSFPTPSLLSPPRVSEQLFPSLCANVKGGGLFHFPGLPGKVSSLDAPFQDRIVWPGAPLPTAPLPRLLEQVARIGRLQRSGAVGFANKEPLGCLELWAGVGGEGSSLTLFRWASKKRGGTFSSPSPSFSSVWECGHLWSFLSSDPSLGQRARDGKGKTTRRGRGWPETEEQKRRAGCCCHPLFLPEPCGSFWSLPPCTRASWQRKKPE